MRQQHEPFGSCGGTRTGFVVYLLLFHLLQLLSLSLLSVLCSLPVAFRLSLVWFGLVSLLRSFGRRRRSSRRHHGASCSCFPPRWWVPNVYEVKKLWVLANLILCALSCCLFRFLVVVAVVADVVMLCIVVVAVVWARDHVDYNYIRKVAIQIRWNSIQAYVATSDILRHSDDRQTDRERQKHTLAKQNQFDFKLTLLTWFFPLLLLLLLLCWLKLFGTLDTDTVWYCQTNICGRFVFVSFDYF